MRGTLVRKGWTQQRLADELGIGKSAVSQLLSGEYGKIPESLLKALDLLDLDLVAVPRQLQPRRQDDRTGK
ncbi:MULTISPECIES: helix-turn-helix domain-containing protein [Deinococcus]|uniref:helix-turn-helix domain-containing protein n=1 Tax=Deinococcus sp. Marseille-Q6407 TaxID=2969223 RepID=UPI001E52FB92|nr:MULTISPECIES: helix-turn-helix domain-containing protein [Deinococcus]